MKKGIVCLLCALMAASLTACKGQPEQEISSTASGTVTAGVSSDSPAEESSAVSERSDAVSSKKAEVSSKAVSSKKAPVSSRQKTKKQTSSKKISKISSTKNTISTPTSVNSLSETTQKTPEQSMAEMLGAISKADSHTVNQYLDDNSWENVNTEGPDLPIQYYQQFYQLMFTDIDYQILDIKESGNHAVLTLQVTNVDLLSIQDDYQNDLDQMIREEIFKPDDQKLSEDELWVKSAEYFIAHLKSAQKTTRTSKVDLILTEEGWKIKDMNQLLIALVGPVGSLAEEQ